MSTQDRIAEREVADFYHENEKADDGPRPRRRVKRFAEAFLTGLAVGSVINKVVR